MYLVASLGSTGFDSVIVLGGELISLGIFLLRTTNETNVTFDTVDYSL